MRGDNKVLNVIVYEDNSNFMKKNINGINRALVNCDIDYRILKFESYSDALDNIIHTKVMKKIYVLDVEMKDVSGIEVASRIREDDFDSIIIFVTAYDKYHNDVFYSRLMVLDFICKYKGYEDRLRDDIVASLKILYRQRTFIFSYNHVVYRIPYGNICYIEKEPLIKRCVIYTINGKFNIAKSLNWIEPRLGAGFVRTHQSCLVNVDNIKNIDFCSNVITFKCGLSTNLLANKKKKEVKERVGISE